ncbi:CHASE3 domain-containing protein [Cohnella sp. JJ-181]|uniref:CHASE3 domain-containing protein n=1 Tax=Cohnella rhizoplanae TaxID=2974897 RepID=UPI0022FF7F79|nr:CHASE3 domain-containing protein [Cohnella sp. JJ-181]CAI6054925.1 Sensor histidine kinase RcsC [Cohnella sp. JJ-181]
MYSQAIRKKKISIRTKILSGNIIVMICLGIAIGALSMRIASLQEEIEFISAHDIQVHETVNQIQKDLLDMETGMRGFIISGDESYLDPYNTGRARWEADLNKLKSLIIDNQAQLRNADSIKEGLTDWITNASENAISYKRSGDAASLNKFFAEKKGKDRTDALRQQLQSFKETEFGLTEARAESLKERNESLIGLLYLLWIIVAAISISTTWLISNTVIRTIRTVGSTIRQIAVEGESLHRRIEVNTRDEMMELGDSTNMLLETIERQNIRKDQVAQIATLLQEQSDIDAVGKQFLNQLVQVFNIPYGVLYVRGQSNHLVKAASYAESTENFGRKEFQIGEGLVGQCAAENRTLIIGDVPGGYVSIQSGIGEASPAVLALLPVCFERNIVGVIEIASFSKLDRSDVELLEQLAGMLGVTIQSVKSRMEMEQLYTETQAANEELQVQSEELNAQSLELLTMNDELKRSSNFKSEFLANMSHELRTPLNSMLILSQMLAENRQGHLSEDDISYVNTIYSAGNDLLNLINDILDLSKVEAGKLDIEMGNIILADLQLNIQSNFQEVAAKKNLDFTVRISPETPAWLETDGFRLQQILKNLLSNAFKFTDSGKVELNVGVRSNNSWGQQEVAFTVTDTGRGIARDKLGLIFEAFTQADSGTARKFGGTGLGLTISASLANLLGGRIEVQSDEGKGSEFTLYLPAQRSIALMDEAMASKQVATSHASLSAADPVSIAVSEMPLSTAELKGRHVLLVDDDARNLFALSHVLESLDMTFTIAHDGLECMDRLRGGDTYDCILMDIMMPDMDGFQAIREIRHTLQLSTPIIAVTAKAMKEDRDKCLEAGANAYISKPVQVQQLVSIMVAQIKVEA